MTIIEHINDYFGSECKNVDEFARELEQEVDTVENYKELLRLLKYIERQE